jgi:hypothetical protein
MLLMQAAFSEEIAAPPRLKFAFFSDLASIQYNDYSSQNNINNNFSFSLLSTRLRVNILPADQYYSYDSTDSFFFEITPVMITKSTDASPPDFSFLNAKIFYVIPLDDFSSIHPLVKCNYLFLTNGTMDFDRFAVKAGVKLGLHGLVGDQAGFHLFYAETGYAYNHSGKSSHNYYLSLGVSFSFNDPTFLILMAFMGSA